MAQNSTVSVRLTPELRERLEAVARDKHRSASEVASEAIEQYLDLDAWQIAHIEAALAEDEASGPGVPHEEVKRWTASWGTDSELPRPEPKKS